MRPLHLYFAGTASWFVNHGIQSVMFAWLVTIVLRESPQMVGIAQMAMLMPALLFMLVGGSLADRYGGRRVAVLAQSFSVVPVLGLLLVLAAGGLSFGIMIGFALMMGLAQAFVTPARDGLLNQVAEGRIQHTVVRVTMIQFSAMLIAFVIVGQTDLVGAVPVIVVQAAVLVLGVVAMRRIPVAAPARTRSDTAMWRELSASVGAGLLTVMRSVPMRMVAVQNVAIGLFFMGSYIVTIPVAVRDMYGGSAADLAMLNAANAFGLALTSFLLTRVGHIRRPRRALLLAQALGAVALGIAGFGFGFPVFATCIFLLRRHRHEHGAHDHAGTGAVRPAWPRDGVLLFLVDGRRAVRRPARRRNGPVVGAGQRLDRSQLRHAHGSRGPRCCFAPVAGVGTRPRLKNAWEARREGSKRGAITV